MKCQELTQEEKLKVTNRIINILGSNLEPNETYICNIARSVIGNIFRENYNVKEYEVSYFYTRDKFLRCTFPELVDFIIKVGNELTEKEFEFGNAWATHYLENEILFKREKMIEFKKQLQDEYKLETSL